MTYLYSYESLAEREQKIAKFSSNPSARAYRHKLGELTEDISSRLLIPAAFAQEPARAEAEKATSSALALAASGADRARGSRRRVCRSLSLDQLRMGGARERDAADRLAAGYRCSGVSEARRRHDGQAGQDAGADSFPGRRLADPASHCESGGSRAW